MSIDANAIYRLIGERFRGNLTAFARAIGVDRVVAWRALNGKSGGTRKFIPAFYTYCKKESINPDDYFENQPA